MDISRFHLAEIFDEISSWLSHLSVLFAQLGLPNDRKLLRA